MYLVLWSQLLESIKINLGRGSYQMPKRKGAFFLDSFLFYVGLQCTVNWPKLFLLIMHISISCRSTWLWLLLTGDISLSRRDFFLSKSPNSWPHRLFVILIFLLHSAVKGWKFVNARPDRLTKSSGAWRVSFLSYSLKVCATYCSPCLTRICRTVTHLI